jgi:hypothetical protein
MKLRRVIFACSLCLLAGAGVLGAEGEMKFPAIEGKALSGVDFKVPDDLTHAHNLILVAFLREQQQDVDTWIPHLERLGESDEEFAFYEFPVLPEMNAVARWWIYHGMRSGINSETARARTVTFHLDKGEFKRRLGIPDESVIRIYLLDAKSNILWQTTGAWSQEKVEDVLQTLAALGADSTQMQEEDPPTD